MKLENFNWLKNRYRFYLLGHALIMVAVIIFFRTISDVKIAALAAGCLFIAGPLLVLHFERRAHSLYKSFSFYGAIVFLLCSSFPIFGLRLMNWNAPFETLALPEAFGGFTGVQLHEVSHHFFTAMLVCFALDSVITTVQNYRVKHGLK